jgi:small conductance mechanosensitive channel
MKVSVRHVILVEKFGLSPIYVSSQNCRFGMSDLLKLQTQALWQYLMYTLIVLFTFLAFTFNNTAFAQEQITNTPAATVDAAVLLDPDLSDEEFTLRLVHLTSAELQKFTKGWIKITQAKTKEAAEVNIELATAEDSDFEKLQVKLGKSLQGRNILFKKFEIVLNEWEAKGAKPENLKEYRDYISAVKRSELKATDIKTRVKQLLDWIMSAQGGGKIGIWVLSLLASLFGVMFLARIITGLLKRALFKIPDMSDLLRNFVSNIVYWLILGIGVTITLSLFGLNMTSLLAVFGGVSFIVGFAMQSTLGNLASGLLLMITKPFDIGDAVNAAGVSGTVQNVSIVSTTILTFDNQVIVVPNTMVWDGVITNVNASETRRVDLMFGIGYGDDTELAKKTLEEILVEHPLVLDDPAPTIRMHELADSSVNFICRPWAKTEDYWTVYWDVLQQAKERFDQVGISIPFPQRDIHVHNAAQVANN